MVTLLVKNNFVFLSLCSPLKDTALLKNPRTLVSLTGLWTLWLMSFALGLSDDRFGLSSFLLSNQRVLWGKYSAGSKPWREKSLGSGCGAVFVHPAMTLVATFLPSQPLDGHDPEHGKWDQVTRSCLMRLWGPTIF